MYLTVRVEGDGTVALYLPPAVGFPCGLFREFFSISAIEGAFGIRLFIRDHLKLETISREETDSGMEQELQKFRDNKKQFSKKIASIQAAQAEKKKSLFAEVEKKLKEQIDKDQH